MKRSKIASLLTVAVLAVTMLFLAFKKYSVSAVERNHYKINFVLAKTSNELLELRNNAKANVLRTVKDFDAVVAASASPALSKLTAGQVKSFRNGLVKNSDGLVVSLRYRDIQQWLSYDDFAEVMGMFGLDVKEGYWGFSKDQRVIDQLSGKITLARHNKVRGAALPDDGDNYMCDKRFHACKPSDGTVCFNVSCY